MPPPSHNTPPLVIVGACSLVIAWGVWRLVYSLGFLPSERVWFDANAPPAERLVWVSRDGVRHRSPHPNNAETLVARGPPPPPVGGRPDAGDLAVWYDPRAKKNPIVGVRRPDDRPLSTEGIIAILLAGPVLLGCCLAMLRTR